MKKYYIADPNQGQIEITEEEYISIFGTEDIKDYVVDIYYNKISISEVPTELQERVQTTVNNRIARFGAYNSQATEEDLYNALAELGVKEND